MARRLSVTVSMAADTSGMFRLISRVNLVSVVTWGHDVGRTGFEQNVVEGEPFANLHWSLHFASRVYLCRPSVSTRRAA
jgi:hypothetical protein